MKCNGKSIAGSDADAVWLGTGVQGPAVIEHAILEATHYNRALEGQSQIAEAMKRLQWKEFFRAKGTTEYTSVFNIIKKRPFVGYL